MPWRVVPAEAAVRAGLGTGRPLDRETARTLARELRRSAALGVAVGALRHRDLSRRRLDERLARRGAGAAARADALGALERSGLVDDARVAARRAETLAGRGWGNAAIRDSLMGEGIGAVDVEAALAALEPETARIRAQLARRSPGPKTLRWLAARGFDAGSLEDCASEDWAARDETPADGAGFADIW